MLSEMPCRLFGLGERVTWPAVRRVERAAGGRVKTDCWAWIPEFLIK